jgi:hypothetical protein
MHADEMQMQLGASEEYSRQRSSLRASEASIEADQDLILTYGRFGAAVHMEANALVDRSECACIPVLCKLPYQERGI